MKLQKLEFIELLIGLNIFIIKIITYLINIILKFNNNLNKILNMENIVIINKWIIFMNLISLNDE